MLRATSMLALTLSISACAAPPKGPAPVTTNPLLCKVPDECNLYWRRAQVWLARHSAYRVQSATDTVIATHGPSPHSVDRAYRVTRVPGTDGRDEITLDSGCANLFGCSTDRNADYASFRLYVQYGR